MAIIVIVRGVADTGKTTSIRLALNGLQQRYPSASFDRPLGMKETSGILTIGNVRIGFESLGDRPNPLIRSVAQLLAARCNGIVCATRSRGRASQYLQGLGSQGHTVFLIEKTKQDPFATANETTAERIIQHLEPLLR